MNQPLSPLFLGAPVSAIPTTKHLGAYQLLKLLADGQLHSREEITQLFGEPWRSYLQNLRGDRFDYWLIHSVKQDQSKTTFLQLDPRHLSGCAKQDAAARLERRKQLKHDSYKEAQQGQARLPKAFIELQEAEKEYFKNLGEAANDETGANNHD